MQLSFIFVLGILSNEEILFRSTNRHKRQVNEEIMPVFLEDLNVTDAVTLVCEGRPHCIFDLLVSGNLEAGMIALNHEKEVNSTQDTISEVSWKYLMNIL